MPKESDLKELILSAAQGAADGIEAIKSAEELPIELAEFEIEATYDCTTELIEEKTKKKRLLFKINKARIGRRRNVRYGLTLRLVFFPTVKEE